MTGAFVLGVLLSAVVAVAAALLAFFQEADDVASSESITYRFTGSQRAINQLCDVLVGLARRDVVEGEGRVVVIEAELVRRELSELEVRWVASHGETGAGLKSVALCG